MRLAWPLALALLLLPWPCFAAPTEAEINAARKLFEKAQEHEAASQWLDALALLERILLIKETAGVRFHAALCREHLGQLLAAEADYRRAAELAAQMRSKEGAAIGEQTAAALAALKPRIPLLNLKIPPVQGLQIEINGVRLGADRWQKAIPRDPGQFTLRATAPGHAEFSRQLALSEGHYETLEIVLSPEAPSPLPSDGPASVAPPTRVPASSPVTPASTPPRWPALVVGGAAVLAAGGGVYFYTQHRRLDRETEDICNDPQFRCDRSGREARLADYRNYGLLSGGLALAGFGAATYLWLSSSPRGSSAALRVGPGHVQLQAAW